MQAHRQWSSRAPDERFTSLIEMQAFKRSIRDSSRSHVLSSRKSKSSRWMATRADCRSWRRPASAPTHWSFGQLCSLASPGNSPASYFRDTRMPAPMIADCLNYNLRFTRGVEDIGVLLTRTGRHVNELRPSTAPLRTHL